MLIMKPKIISLNVRGMNEPKKRTKIRRLLREQKADIMCLQETKMEVISRSNYLSPPSTTCHCQYATTN
jgi:exonuclease III